MRHSILGLAVAPLALMVTTSCTGAFGPVYDPNSDPFEASYELREAGQKFGAAHITASSAESAEFEGQTVTVLEVSLAIENATDEEITLAKKNLRLAFVDTPKGRIDEDAVRIAKQETTEKSEDAVALKITFALPPGYETGDVLAFGVRWEVERAGERYGETTSFAVPRPDSPPIVYYPYGGLAYYDPNYGGTFAAPWGGATIVDGPMHRHGAHPTTSPVQQLAPVERTPALPSRGK